MIRHIEIDNFKSLVGFKMPLEQFTCLVGLNGAGKTTLLQAVDFLAQVMTGRVMEWLKAREWSAVHLVSSLKRKNPLITFKVNLELEGRKVQWEGTFNTNKNKLYCTRESLKADGEDILSVSDGSYRVNGKGYGQIPFKYEGSILSALKIDTVVFGDHKQWKVHTVRHLIDFFQDLKSLELLSPHLMRQRAREAEDIGVGGEKLSAFLYSLSNSERQKLNERLQKDFSPTLQEIRTRSIKSGWKKLLVVERHPKGQEDGFETEARHLNDGLLRQLAIIAQTLTSHRFLLLTRLKTV